MYFVKLLEDADGMMYMNINLKCVLAFICVFDLDFLFILEIWNYVQNGSGYTLISMSCQKFTVSPTINDLVDMCPITWCKNSKETFLLRICFCDFNFSFVLTKNACFICAMCGNVTALCSLSQNKNVQKSLWKRQVCLEFINTIMENNQLHKSGANRTLYNVAMKGFTLSSHITILTSPVCFTVTKFLSATSIYLSVSTNWPGIKYEISGIMWQVAPDSKIKLVSCEPFHNIF